MDKDFKQMYVNLWNLSIQRQIGAWLVTANYVGNSTIHLNTSTTANPAEFLGLGACAVECRSGERDGRSAELPDLFDDRE